MNFSRDSVFKGHGIASPMVSDISKKYHLSRVLHPFFSSLLLSSYLPLPSLNFKECKLDLRGSVANDIKTPRQGLQDVISRQASMTEGIVSARQRSTFYEEKNLPSHLPRSAPYIPYTLLVTSRFRSRSNCHHASHVPRAKICFVCVSFCQSSL